MVGGCPAQDPGTLHPSPRCRVVGGFDTLTAMENVESDPKTDRPKEDVRIEAATVFVDPYEEADAQIAEERKKTQLEAAPEAPAKAPQPQAGSQGPQTYRQGVGKYINPAATKRAAEEEPAASAAAPVPKKQAGRGGFGDFSSW